MTNWLLTFESNTKVAIIVREYVKKLKNAEFVSLWSVNNKDAVSKGDEVEPKNE